MVVTENALCQLTICDWLFAMFYEGWNVILIRKNVLPQFIKVKAKGKQLVDQVADQSAELIHKWENNSREFIGTFLQLFGPDSFSQFLDGTKQRIVRAISPAPSGNLEIDHGADEEIPQNNFAIFRSG